MKLILTTVMATILFSSVGLSASAQIVPQVTPPTDYKLLAPLPGLTTNGQTTDINTYIPNAVKLIIGLAIALAVLMIIWGGFEYILSASVNTKSNGRERIKDALIGLLLVISSYVILNTINPDLVKFNISLVNVGSNKPIDSGTVSTNPTGGSTSNNGDTAGGTSAGQPWGSDAGSRAQLLNANIGINFPNCTTIGQSGCTSVSMISPSVTQGLIALKADCNCQIEVTGGTEYWLHGNPRTTELPQVQNTLHVPTYANIPGAGTVVDLSLGTNVTDFLRKTAVPSTNYNTCVIGKANGAERYVYNGILFVNETIPNNPAHWHVCFNNSGGTGNF